MTRPSFLRTAAAAVISCLTWTTLTMDDGATLANHGQFNFIVVIIVWSLSLILYLVYLLIATIRVLNWKRRLILCSVMVGALALLFLRAAAAGKEKWPIGLNGAKLQYDWPHCSIPRSFVNVMEMFPVGYTLPFFASTCQAKLSFYDFNAWISKEDGLLHVTCDHPDGALIIEAPDFLRERREIPGVETEFVEFLSQRAPTKITYKYSSPTKPSREYITVRCGSGDEVMERFLLRAIPRDALSNRIVEPTTTPLNLVVLLIDNISRAHFYRRLPLTANVRSNLCFYFSAWRLMLTSFIRL